jgi:hypothetical protein
MAKRINREEIKAEVKRRQQNAARDYAEKANLIAAGYKTAKTNSASGSAGKKPIEASNSKSNVLSQIDEIRNDLGSRNKLSADALMANNPAYVYTKAYGDGKTGAAANRPVKGTATPRSRFEPAETGRPLGRASAQRAFTSTPTGNFKGEAILKSALSSSGAAYKKLGADVMSPTGNLSMGESARAAINEAKTAKKEGRQVRPGQAQRKAEQEKIKSFNDGWAGDFKQKLLESAEESSKRAYEYEQEAKQGLGKFGQGVVDFGIAGAQFAGDALLNAVAPGTGIAAMAGRAYGSASLDAQQRGLSEGEQQISGLKSAAIEVLTEKLFGSVSKVAYGKGIIRNESLVNSLVNRLAKTDKGRTALKVLVGANEEGMEEVLSDILNPIADRILKLDDGKGDWSDLADDYDTQQMLEDYIIGGALGLAGAGTNVVSGQYRAENAQQRAYEEYQRQLVNAGLATEQGGDAQLTAEKYKSIIDQSTQRGKRNLSDKETENLERLMTIGTDTQTVRDMLAQSGVLVDDNTAQAAALAASGQKLSSTQNAAIGNAAVQDAINQMAGNGVVDNIRRTAANEYSKPIVINSMARQYEVAPEVVERTYNLNPTAPQAFETAFNAVYQMGQQGTDKAALGKVPVLSTAQANIAYQMGADSVMSTETAAPVTINNTQEVNDNGVRIHNVEERINGQNTEVQIRGVETGTGENVAGGSQKEQGGVGAAQIKAGEKVSYKGKQQKGVYYAAEDTEDMKKGRKLAESYGYKVTYFVGGNIRYAGGEFRGAVDTAKKTVMVRADHPDYTAEQIMRHEMGHAAFENGDLSLNEAKEMLLDDFTEDELNELVEIYSSEYGGILSAEEAFEEICCDALGRMNIFEGTDLNSESYGKAQDTVRKYAAERTGSKGRAPPKKGGVKYSYAGKHARTADLEQLERAKQMQTQGADMKSIRKATGWFKGMDGKWRFEIDDSEMTYHRGGDAAFSRGHPDYAEYQKLMRKWMTGEVTAEEETRLRQMDETWGREYGRLSERVDRGNATLEDILDHEALFRAYPQLRRTKVEFADMPKNTMGSYSPSQNLITLSNELRNAPESTLVHEIQHAMQNAEGFTRGSNREYWEEKLTSGDKIQSKGFQDAREKLIQFQLGKANEEALALKDKIEQAGELDDDLTEYDRLWEEAERRGLDGKINEYYDLLNNYYTQMNRPGNSVPSELYYNTAGEIEARDAANRRSMSDWTRKMVPPDYGDENTVFAEDSSYAMSQSEQDSVKTQLREHQGELNSMKAVATIRDNGWRGMSTGAFRKKIVNSLKKTGYRVDNPDIGVIDFDEKMLNRSLNYIQTDAEAAAYQALPMVLKRGIEISGHGNHKGRDYETLTIAAPVELNGKRGNMAAVVMKTKGNRYKVHRILTPEGTAFALPEMTNAEPTTVGTVTSGSQSLGGSAPAISSASENSIRSSSKNVNKQFSREPERLNELRRQNERKLAQATAEDAANENERGLIRDYKKQYSKVEDIREKLSAAQQTLTEAEDSGADYDTTTKAKNRFTVLSNQYAREHRKLESYAKMKALQNILTRVDERLGNDLPEGMGAASANFTGEETVGERWVTEAQGEGDSALHPISKEQEANLAEQQRRAPQEIPKEDLNGKLTSKHVSTIANSGMTPAEFSDALREDAALGKFSHIAYSDEEALKKANRTIEIDGWEQALANYKAEINSGRVSKDNTVMGIALYNNAVNSGDYATAMDIASLMVKNSTNTAQSLQAMRILNKLSPECRLYLAAKSIENIEEDLNERYKDNKADIHVDKILYDEYAKALRQGDEDGIKTAWANIEQSVARQIDATWYEKLNNFRYLAMLGNPRTHVRNIVGNAFFVPVRAVKNTIAYGLENIADAKINGGIERSKAILNSSNAADAALVKYAMSDYEAVQEVILSGGKYVDTFQGIDKHRTIYKTKILEAARKGNSAALDAEDAWFCKPAYANALAKWYKANGISAEQLNTGKVPEETIIKAQTIAIKEAQKATYRDTNWFSAQVSRLGKVDNKVAAVLIEGVLPFKKTPANILARAVEYSPVGLIKSLALDTKKVKAYVNGDIENGMSPAEFIDDISAGLTGSALMGLGILLASWGVLSGGDDDDEKQNYFDELSGKQNYALSIGGMSITLDWLAPESMPLFVGVELFNSLSSKNEDKGFLQNLMSSVMSLSTPMFEMSMLQSVNDLFDNLAYIKQGQGTFKIVSSMAANYISQYFPTLFGQAERSFEEAQRETTYIDRNSKVGSELQYMWGKIANKIPFYDFSQIPYIDAWGRTEETGNLFERMLNNFVNPAYVKKERPTEIDGELERLYDLGETSVYPSRAKTNTKINGEYLTADEYVKYATTKGQTSYELAQGVINSAAYSGAADPEKAYMLKYVYSYADHIAKYEVNNDYSLAKWEMAAYKSANPMQTIIDHAREYYNPDKEN